MAGSARRFAAVHADHRDCAYPTRAPRQTLLAHQRRIYTPLLRPLDRLLFPLLRTATARISYSRHTSEP